MYIKRGPRIVGVIIRERQNKTQNIFRERKAHQRPGLYVTCKQRTCKSSKPSVNLLMGGIS